MTIDSATLAFQNKPYAVPKAMQGSGARIAPNAPIDRSSKLYEQCREFESLFVNMMLKTMRDTVEKSGLVDGGQAEDIFSDMLYDEYARDMTKNAGFGFADTVYRELARA